jgi:diacylglycerol kinase family enzyme
LGAGAAAGQIFFENASCGVLPQIVQWPESFREAESFGEAWQEMMRAANLLGLLVRPGLRIRREDETECSVGVLQITTQAFAPASRRPALSTPRFDCALWSHAGLFHYGASVLRAAGGGDWRRGGHADRFDCATLSIGGHDGFWFLLDGDPVRLEGAVDVRFIPRAVRTFMFRRMEGGTA